MNDSPPRRRLGRYELIAEIAAGGMGIVCLARSVGVGGFRRLFAIKVMHPHLVRDQQFVGMLLDEAQLAARIHHPNVVATVDICTVDDCYFVVMDYIDGFQLLNVLENQSIGRQDRIRVVNRILLDAMAGLEAAHTLKGDDESPLNLVHRDVSPQNILIGLDGIGRLTDFGIALAASRISSSRPGTIKGKPAYMAPEQARATNVDRRADLWAIGVILWEMLAGQRLFVGDTEAATVLKVIDSPIEPPRNRAPDVPPALEAVCMRALERDPNRRYATARQMAAELERAAVSSGTLADSHEVADTLRQHFAHDIEQRRLSIRGHAAAIGANSLPMGPRDIYELPQLSDAPPPGVVLSPLPRTPTPSTTKLSPTPATSPIAVTALAPTPRGALLEHTPAAPGLVTPPPPTARTTMGSSSAEVPARSGSRSGWFLVLALLVAGLGGGYWYYDRQRTQADAEAPLGPSAAPVAEKAPAAPAASAPELVVAPADPTPTVAVTPDPRALPSASEQAQTKTNPPPARLPGRPARPAAPQPKKSDPKSPGSKSPVVEENPYGLR
jgi:serine/threonine protein kinase